MEHFLGLKEQKEKGLEDSFNSWEKWMNPCVSASWNISHLIDLTTCWLKKA